MRKWIWTEENEKIRLLARHRVLERIYVTSSASNSLGKNWPPLPSVAWYVRGLTNFNLARRVWLVPSDWCCERHVFTNYTRCRSWLGGHFFFNKLRWSSQDLQTNFCLHCRMHLNTTQKTPSQFSVTIPSRHNTAMR